MYGLTPKVEAAIPMPFEQQWQRMRMLMDPLHPADKADFGKTFFRGFAPCGQTAWARF